VDCVLAGDAVDRSTKGDREEHEADPVRGPPRDDQHADDQEGQPGGQPVDGVPGGDLGELVREGRAGVEHGEPPIRHSEQAGQSENRPRQDARASRSHVSLRSRWCHRSRRGGRVLAR
jgi:hypothetical protein